MLMGVLFRSESGGFVYDRYVGGVGYGMGIWRGIVTRNYFDVVAGDCGLISSSSVTVRC